MRTFNIYQRETLDQQPVRIATGLTVKNYSIDGLTKGKKYLFSVGAVKNGVEKIGNEKVILAGSAWSPLNLTNPPKIVIDSINAVADGGNLVSQLTDLSGNGYNFTQQNQTRKPSLSFDHTLQKNVVIFDGDDDVLVGSSALKSVFKNSNIIYSFFVVARTSLDTVFRNRSLIFISTNGSKARFVPQIGSSENSIMMNMIDFGSRRLDTDSFSNQSSNVQSTLDYQLLLFKVDYSSGIKKIYINGQVVSSESVATGNISNADSNENICLAARQEATTGFERHSNIKFAEMIVGNRNISESEVDKVFGYLAHKYGLENKLPTNHPYKVLVPTI